MFKKIFAALTVAWLAGSGVLAADGTDHADKQGTTSATSTGATQQGNKPTPESGSSAGKPPALPSDAPKGVQKTETPVSPESPKVSKSAPPLSTTPPPEKKKGKKHHDKKRKSNEVDGEPLGSIGARKRVDKGFDFENSQGYGTTQQP